MLPGVISFQNLYCLDGGAIAGVQLSLVSTVSGVVAPSTPGAMSYAWDLPIPPGSKPGAVHKPQSALAGKVELRKSDLDMTERKRVLLGSIVQWYEETAKSPITEVRLLVVD